MFRFQGSQTANQVCTFDYALVPSHILVANTFVVSKAKSTNGLLIRLYHQVGGILVLPCAFGTDHIVLPEHFYPLYHKYCNIILAFCHAQCNIFLLFCVASCNIFLKLIL